MSYIDGSLPAGERVVFCNPLHLKLLVGPLLFPVTTLPPNSLQRSQAQQWASIS